MFSYDAFDFQNDQADGLRRIMAGPKPRIFSLLAANILYTKQNTPYTTEDNQPKIISNLASSLHRLGAEVLVVHAGQQGDEATRQYGLKNLPSIMDKVIDNFANDTQLLDGNHALGHHGLDYQDLEQHGAFKHLTQGFSTARLIPQRTTINQYDDASVGLLNNHFIKIASKYEIVLVDTVLTEQLTLPLDMLNQSEIVIQLNQKPVSIKNAYSLIKLLCNQLGRRPFSILIHDANESEAQNVFNNIAEVARRFMHIELEFIGFIPADDHLSHATKLGRSVVEAFPMASASQAFKAMALKLDYRQDHRSQARLDLCSTYKKLNLEA